MARADGIAGFRKSLGARQLVGDDPVSTRLLHRDAPPMSQAQAASALSQMPLYGRVAVSTLCLSSGGKGSRPEADKESKRYAQDKRRLEHGTHAAL